MKNYICNSEKYISSKGYIHLPVQINGSLPKTVFIDGNNLSLKSSFHVSLICTKELVAKYGDESLEQKIVKRFCDFVSKEDINFIKFTGEFRLAILEERKTVIARCEVSNLENFTKELSKDLGVDIPTQPTHVTLYTLQPDMGIGLNSFEVLEHKSRTIDVPVEVRSGLGIN